MKILALGDVCGAPGVETVRKNLSRLKNELSPDLVILNGENASGRGISPDDAGELFRAGVDVITLGNHAFSNRQICEYLDEHKDIIRPLNMPKMPGEGKAVVDVQGVRVCVANILGRLNMSFNVENPFEAAERLLESTDADLFVIDFHAEATSEKKAFGFSFSERAAVIFGTHTHVQTADECILPGGCGYITDLGMTGSALSVIGVKPQQSIDFFRGKLTQRFESAEEDCRLQGALFTIGQDKKCSNVERINFI